MRPTDVVAVRRLIAQAHDRLPFADLDVFQPQGRHHWHDLVHERADLLAGRTAGRTAVQTAVQSRRH
jgi:hypothetical protein